MPSFNTVERFENIISDFFNSRYAVAVDSCTHGIELCLIHDKVVQTSCPKHTYLSIPMTLSKLGIDWRFNNKDWSYYYYLEGTRIIDGAVLWKRGSYIPGTLMCLSFQFRKHLGIGRGGMILLDDYNTYKKLKRLSYDGRDMNTLWTEQDITEMGYHYYMTPESAEYGIKRFREVKNLQPKIWTNEDYPDISKLTVFQNECL